MEFSLLFFILLVIHLSLILYSWFYECL